MKKTIAMAFLLFSSQLLAADIYEFRHDWDTQPAPAKTQAKPQPKPEKPAAATPQTSAATNAPSAASTATPATPPDAVVHMDDCAHGVHCNDL